MNKCACGCGEIVKGIWKRGHIGKTVEGKRKITPWAVEIHSYCMKIKSAIPELQRGIKACEKNKTLLVATHAASVIGMDKSCR